MNGYDDWKQTPTVNEDKEKFYEYIHDMSNNDFLKEIEADKKFLEVVVDEFKNRYIEHKFGR